MDAQYLYFIFENCENGDLANLISERRKLSLQVTVIYAAQLVHALIILQSKEVMHRDLKPQNIMLDAKMNIKIVITLYQIKLTNAYLLCRLIWAMLRK